MIQKIKNIFKSILASIYFPLFVEKTKRKIIETKPKDNYPEKYFDWTENFYVGPNIKGLNVNFKAAQIKEEILSLLYELKQNPPRLLLEIGTATGGTLFMLTQIAAEDAEIYSIDLPLGPYGAGYFKYKIPLFKSFTKKQQKINLIRKDSHDINTVHLIQSLLNNKKLDFLFIDGDHTYEGVKKDFKLYSPLVKSDGLIAFHDIKKDLLDSNVEVDKFWQEIKNKYQFKEFISNNKNQSGCGIGLIYNK